MPAHQAIGERGLGRGLGMTGVLGQGAGGGLWSLLLDTQFGARLMGRLGPENGAMVHTHWYQVPCAGGGLSSYLVEQQAAYPLLF